MDRRPFEFIEGKVLFYPNLRDNPDLTNVYVFPDRFEFESRPNKPNYFRVVFETSHHLVLLVRRDLSTEGEPSKPSDILFSFYALVRHHRLSYRMYQFSCTLISRNLESLIKGPVIAIRLYYFQSRCHPSYYTNKEGEIRWNWGNFTLFSVRDN